MTSVRFLRYVVAVVLTGPVAAVATLVSVVAGARVFATTVRAFLAAARRRPRELAPGDPAELTYLAGPAFRDHRQLTTDTAKAVYQRMLLLDANAADRSLLGRVWLDQPADPVWQAPTAGAAFGVIVGFVTVSALGGASLLAALVLLGVTAGVVRVVAATSWLLETGLLTVRGITVECGICHERMARPVFACPCGNRHRNLMPDARGTFHHICRCGRRLPTLLMLGKRRLNAHCGHCGAPLPGPVQSVPTFHLPVVGGVAAGKSVFMLAAMSRLYQERHNAPFIPADASTALRLEEGRRSLLDGVLPPRTPLGRPVAYTVRRGDKQLLHVYDAAGEILEQAQNLAVATFLGLSDGIVFVIDPFALPAVRDRADPSTLRDTWPSGTDPKTVLDGLVQNLQEHGARRPPVAVAITKADALLAVPGVCHPYAGVPTDRAARSAAARKWLVDQNHADVTNSLDRHFPKVGYFTVTYHDATAPPVINDDPAAPILWLLNGAPI
ncbi:MAG TPA: hypothetical protein VH352_17940 [Pseudonocardiaceae bacterium]|nr:hypothetical protein [Pseudonocardiaceae bacterium]